MNKLLQFLIIFFINVNSFSQSLTEEMNGLLGQIEKNIPADQLFLQLDRNLYHGGDTIRFKAYIRDNQTGIFETKSLSLYVLLLNSEHVTIDSARFRISYSTASGWLKVPDFTPLGYYSILAFTSDQMNYSPEFAFNSIIKIGKISLDRNETDSLILVSQTSGDLKFLPEGGTFIYGSMQKLAFNAVSPKGKSINVSGLIVNQKGEKITDFKSGPFGPGIVEFTPVQGDTYYAKPVEAEFMNISWPLPVPEKSGVSLRVNNTKSGSIDIALNGNETDGKEYFLTVTLSNILIFSKNVKLDTPFNARINTAEIPSGTAIVTLYDNEFNPKAERLIFLNGQKKMNVKIGVSTPVARIGKETELTIKTTDEKGKNISSIVSVSVIDSLLGFYNSIPYPDIESIFLYDREFYNNLPLSIRCLGNNNIDSESFDLLLLTYGWRKYTLKETELVIQKKRSDDYDHLKISNQGKEIKGRQVIKLFSPEGGGVITLGIDNNREAVLPYDSLDIMARQIMILPDDDPSRNTNPVNIKFPENKTYTNNVKLIKIDSTYSDTEIASDNREMPLFNSDSAIMIDAVTIKGHKKKSTEYVDKNAQQFKHTGAFTLFSKDFEGAQTFEDILYKLGAYYVDKKNKLVILRSIRYLNGYQSALFVVDDSPIFNRTYFPIAQMPASEVASVTVLRGSQGFSRYGNDASNGVIIVTTKTGIRINGGIVPEDEASQHNNLLKSIRLFRSEVEYYIPTKEQVEIVPEYQYRPTILWKDEVFIDESGTVKIKYPNNLVKGTAMIFVNGVSFTNLIGSNKYTYTIE
jgi:alpha-2-macroglobulin-like protein